MLLLKRTKPIPHGHTTALLMAAIYSKFDQIEKPDGLHWMTAEEKAKCAVILWALDRSKPYGAVTTIAELIYFENHYWKPSNCVLAALTEDRGFTYDPEESTPAVYPEKLYNDVLPRMEDIEKAMKAELRFYPWQAVTRVNEIMNPVEE